MSEDKNLGKVGLCHGWWKNVILMQGQSVSNWLCYFNNEACAVVFYLNLLYFILEELPGISSDTLEIWFII